MTARRQYVAVMSDVEILADPTPVERAYAALDVIDDHLHHQGATAQASVNAAFRELAICLDAIYGPLPWRQPNHHMIQGDSDE